MIEILGIWFLARRVGRIVQQKGHKPGWFRALAVAFWIGGEILGAIIGGTVGTIVVGNTESPLLLAFMYGFALGGAALGAGTILLIARNLSPTDTEEEPKTFFQRWGMIVVTGGGGLALCVCLAFVAIVARARLGGVQSFSTGGGEIDIGDSITVQKDDSGLHLWSFDGQEGQDVTITVVTTPDTQIAVILQDSANAEIISARSKGEAVASAVLPRTETYGIVVALTPPHTTYTLSLESP